MSFKVESSIWHFPLSRQIQTSWFSGKNTIRRFHDHVIYVGFLYFPTVCLILNEYTYSTFFLSRYQGSIVFFKTILYTKYGCIPRYTTGKSHGSSNYNMVTNITKMGNLTFKKGKLLEILGRSLMIG